MLVMLCYCNDVWFVDLLFWLLVYDCLGYSFSLLVLGLLECWLV